MARAAALHQASVAAIQPEITALQARLKHDPRRLAAETKQLFDRAGISMLPTASLLGSLAQMPLLVALFAAVRKTAAVGGAFLWVRDISRPDVIIAVIATALTGLGFVAGPQPAADQKWILLAVSTAITAVTLWQMAAGVGLYWGVSSAVGIAQSLAVTRARARAAV
jgi:YidC/Oxa1 family membrane protein insertase